MKRLVVHKKAKIELDEAMAYYEKQGKGLGLDLLKQVELATEKIQQTPRIGPPHKNTGFRKCFVKRFPYIVFYMELADAIWIAAIAHTKRKPDYWTGRSPE